jgi:hypothetical protein
MQTITTVGLDIAKSVFQVHCVDASGDVVLRRQLKRRYLLAFFQKLPACLVGIEACVSSHHWSRQLQALGHTRSPSTRVATEARGWRSTFRRSIARLVPQPGQNTSSHGSPRSARPGSSATTAGRGCRQAARSSARRRPLPRRAPPHRQPADWWQCPGPASERPSPQYPRKLSLNPADAAGLRLAHFAA